MKYALSLMLAWNLMAAPPPAATPQPPQAQQKVKKKGGRNKWIVLGAVAGGTAIALALTAKRLGNEGVRIFR